MTLVVRALVALLVLGVVASPASAADPPAISMSPSLPSTWLAGGRYAVKVTASSAVRIQSVRVFLPTAERTKAIAFVCGLASGSCMNPTLSFTVDPTELREGAAAISIEATDVEGNGSTSRIALRVDHTAPAALGAVSVDGAQGWRAANRFDVGWGALAPDNGSPVSVAQYALCPLSRAGDCLSGRRELSGASGLSGIGVPGSGVWSLRVALEDEAGNVDLDVPPQATLYLDAEPPALAFAPNADDPARLELSVADADSGLAGATIEARRRGDDAWRVLASGTTSPIVAHLTDELLAGGTYEIRGRAVDVVGNERTTGTWSNGDAVVVRLPVRQGTKLVAGIDQRKGAKLRPRVTLAFGKRATVRGAVTSETGAARAGVAVRVSERQITPGAPWRVMTTLATNGSGEFTYRARSGPSRTLRFEYSGSPSARAATANVDLRVRAQTSLTASKRRLRNGQTVVLRGTLKGPIPATGKLLTLQARIPGGWRTFGTPRARAKDGRWSYRYRFTRTPTSSRYTFRVVVPQEAAFPYVTGVSRRLDVVVSA